VTTQTTPAPEAVRELAHVAGHLLDRLTEIDPCMPGSIREALRSKIDFYATPDLGHRELAAALAAVDAAHPMTQPEYHALLALAATVRRLLPAAPADTTLKESHHEFPRC
jgi:tRNA(Met) C34 N-acetyltransferase TmcA